MKKIVIALIFILILTPDFKAQETNESPIKVFLLAGQSNMDGCGVGDELPANYGTPPENVRVWDNKEKKWVKLGETTFSKRRKKQFGPEMKFSHRISKVFSDHQIRIIKTSGGGTKLYKHWLPDSAMYKRFVANIDVALESLKVRNQKVEICGMLWMQGESDSETIEMAEAYEDNLKVFFAAIREEVNVRELPIVMGRISSKLLLDTPWVFDQTTIVQQAQERVAATDPNVFIINTDKLSTLWDNTHFDTKAQLKLGKQMAKIMIGELGK